MIRSDIRMFTNVFLQVEKLFDVACTLTDVMTCVPFQPSAFEVGPREYLHQFLTLISTLRGGDSRFLPLLLAKVNEALPTMVAPIARPILSSEEDPVKIEEIREGLASEANTTPSETPPVSLVNTPSNDSPVFYGSTGGPEMSSVSSYSDISVVAPIPRSAFRLPLATYLD